MDLHGLPGRMMAVVPHHSDLLRNMGRSEVADIRILIPFCLWFWFLAYVKFAMTCFGEGNTVSVKRNRKKYYAI